MVSRNRPSRSPSPPYNLHVELDNKALKAKNSGLTQSVAKLQQENAELLKQINYLQRESFEINSRYNNLKNVVSIIDSTTKTCLPKLTEVVDTFTGIIQLCSVASNISNTNRDARTQAVKPQIVNGHVLHNPIITLSRLEGDENAFTPPRASNHGNISNVTIRPGTSRSTSDGGNERSVSVENSEGHIDDDENESREHVSIRRQANVGVSNRRRAFVDSDSSESPKENSDVSDEELEMPLEEGENETDESRLSTIQEAEERVEDLRSPCTLRTKQRRFSQGRLQEVRIYLNQLPNKYVDQIRGSGNISISVTPPERRSSFKHKASLTDEPNENEVDDSELFLDKDMSPQSRRVTMNRRNVKRLSIDGAQSSVSVSFNCPVSASSPAVDTIGGYPESSSMQYSQSILSNISPMASTSRFDPMPSTSRFVANSPISDSKMIFLKGSPLSAKSGNSSLNKSTERESPKVYEKDETRRRKNNITKRKKSRGKHEVAQVVLDRLNSEIKRRSGSPLKGLGDIVNTPPITKSSEIRCRLRNSGSRGDETTNGSPPKAKRSQKSEKDPKITKKTHQEKLIKENLIKQEVVSPLKKSPRGRPKRATRTNKAMKEPSLVKKLRRSR